MAHEQEKKEPKKIYRPGHMIKKSNIIISSKFKSTIFENRLLSLGYNRITNGKYEMKDGSIVVSFTSAELRKIFNVNYRSGGFYTELTNTAAALTGRAIGNVDPEAEEFVFLALINRAEYRDGIFTLKFNADLTEYLTPSSNFSRLDMRTLMSFKHNSAFRLYEILRSRCFHTDGRSTVGDTFEVKYSISELRTLMGLINTEEKNVRIVLEKKGLPDYEAAEKAASTVLYKEWKDFKRYVDTAIKEINKKTELEVSYKTERKGKGGKIVALIFRVYVKGHRIQEKKKEEQEKQEKVILDEKGKVKVTFETYAVLEQKFDVEDVMKICEVAEYDLDQIKKAYQMFKEQKILPENPTGWMISCIKEKWYEQTAPVIEQSSQKKKTAKENRNAEIIRLIAEGKVDIPPEAVDILIASNLPIEFVIENYGVD